MVKRIGGASLQSISIDRNSPKTIAAQLCSALRDLILGGSLRAGQRLPATRTLAKDLGTARATVIEAFEQLTAEGLLESRTGAGTFVSQALDAERPVGPVSDAHATTVREVRVSRLMAAASARFVHRLPHLPRAFTTAMPDFDAFPMAQWSRIASKHWRSARQFALGYGEAQGFRPLRQAIAAHLRADRGIACDWQQVFVVAGAQNAFQLIASTLIDPGDKVWFENPGAIGARNSFILHGADLVPVPVDDDGLDVARGKMLAPDFKAVFVTPAHQQPLGCKMSLERRFALLQAVEEAGAWIIEDDWDGELCFVGRPLPTLRGIDSTGRVIYVGTFSKSMMPSLRLGFLLAPPALVETFETALEAFSPGVPTSLQAQDLRGKVRVPGRRGAGASGTLARYPADDDRAAHGGPLARPAARRRGLRARGEPWADRRAHQQVLHDAGRYRGPRARLWRPHAASDSSGRCRARGGAGDLRIRTVRPEKEDRACRGAGIVVRPNS